MDVRSAIQQFIDAPGDQSYGDDRQPLQRADDRARPAGNAVARAMGDAVDLFQGVPVETTALARFVRTNFHSESPNEAAEQTSLIAALSIALERGPSRPREVGPDHGKFSPGIEIDTSRTRVSPAPPLRSDTRVLQALVDVVERSPGRQWNGTTASSESVDGVANRATLDRFAMVLQTYAMYTVAPLNMDETQARKWLAGCIRTHFVGPEPYKGDPRIDPAAVARAVDELLAYAQRSVDAPAP